MKYLLIIKVTITFYLVINKALLKSPNKQNNIINIRLGSPLANEGKKRTKKEKGNKNPDS